MPKLRSQVNKNKQHGFTLVELLVVIAIISLMASVGSGMLVGTFQRLKVDKTASNLLLTAKYARMMAVEQQRRYTLCLDQVNNGFYLMTTLYDEESGQIGNVIVHDPYCKPVTFDGNVRYEDIQITPISLVTSSDSDDLSTIALMPDGTAQSAIVQIGNDKLHYTLSINAATGKAKLVSGTAENVKVSTVDLDAQT